MTEDSRHILTEQAGSRLEVPGSNLGRNNGYPEDIHGCPQPLDGNAGILPQIKLRPLPSTFFPIRYSLIILLVEVIQPEIMKALLNK
jgi:hypothetical protein